MVAAWTASRPRAIAVAASPTKMTAHASTGAIEAWTSARSGAYVAPYGRAAHIAHSTSSDTTCATGSTTASRTSRLPSPVITPTATTTRNAITTPP